MLFIVVSERFSPDEGTAPKPHRIFMGGMAGMGGMGIVNELLARPAGSQPPPPCSSG